MVHIIHTTLIYQILVVKDIQLIIIHGKLNLNNLNSDAVNQTTALYFTHLE